MIPTLPDIDPNAARAMVAAVPPARVRAEIDEEEAERERRRAARAHRSGSGRRTHCGGCYWVLRNAAQRCPRCGYTKGYGYPR